MPVSPCAVVDRAAVAGDAGTRLLVHPLDVLLQLGRLDAPLQPTADLDGGQLTGAHERVGLRRRDVQHLGDVREGQEPRRHDRSVARGGARTRLSTMLRSRRSADGRMAVCSDAPRTRGADGHERDGPARTGGGTAATPRLARPPAPGGRRDGRRVGAARLVGGADGAGHGPRVRDARRAGAGRPRDGRGPRGRRRPAGHGQPRPLPARRPAGRRRRRGGPCRRPRRAGARVGGGLVRRPRSATRLGDAHPRTVQRRGARCARGPVVHPARPEGRHRDRRSRTSWPAASRSPR